MRALRPLPLFAALPLLVGCNVVLLEPAGDVALQQRNLLIASTGLMLLIILPVMALTLFFAWHFRATNEEAVYDPDFHHSTSLEVAIWSAPLLIIIRLQEFRYADATAIATVMLVASFLLLLLINLLQRWSEHRSGKRS